MSSRNPFGNYDAWRKHPILRATHVKDIFPGFGTAVVIFSGYLVLEQVYKRIWRRQPARPHGASLEDTHH